MRKLAGVGITVRRRSVRHRLLAIALLPTLVILPLLLGIGIYRWNDKFDAALISKVNDDLTIAHQYLAHILEVTESELVSLTTSARFEEAIQVRNDAGNMLTPFLAEAARARELDFLYVVDAGGRIIASGYPLASDSIRRDWPILDAAFEGRPATGIDVLSQDELAAISPELAQQARIEIVPTAGSVADARTEEARGLVLQSADPLALPDGRKAALVGGVLLNHNLGFVDTINDLIYHGPGLPEGSRGTVTLFLDDVRISTNVRLFEDRRAIGTRVSEEVRKAVLGEGRTWLDRAFVVNDWYVSAYEPILDTYGRRVGMLYAGFLEKPFAQAKRQTVLEIALAFLIAIAATVPLFLTWAATIFRPLERMTRIIGRVKGGDLDARTGQTEARDEIGQVALHLDHLLDQLVERDAELHRWNGDLNRRVEQRTSELQLANEQLEATTRQLIMSEKLATIGEITAGIAHEINNPVTVMQGSLEVIRDVMGSKADAARTEFRLIDEQLRRIGEIVTRLLQFAKPHEYAPYGEQYDIADLVTDTVPLVQHLLNKTTISVECDYQATRLISMNRTEFQQVLVNLLVNAIHAMPDGGKLTIRTLDREWGHRPGVAVEVADTGTGMAPDVMLRVFDPFFTTKRREGTGLGLSISQMLMTRRGGSISVDSEHGNGTTFTVWLPEAR